MRIAIHNMPDADEIPALLTPIMTVEKVMESFSLIKSNPGLPVSDLCERIAVLFPFLAKDDQAEFSSNFYEWSIRERRKDVVLCCYARLFVLANLFFRERHEEALVKGPALQQSFLDAGEQAAAMVVGVLIGSIQRTLGNLELSLKTLWECYGQLEKFDRFHHYKIAASFHIGSMYMDMNNEEEALIVLKNSLALAEKEQDGLMMIYTAYGLGKLYLRQQNFKNAHLIFQKAMRLAEATEMPSTISSAQTEMGNYYFEIGDFDSAESLNTQAVETRIANNFIGGAITNYVKLGEIYIRQSRPDEAIGVLNKGLALAEQIKVKPKIYQIHFLLSEVYHCKNDLPKSLFHYKQFHCLREQVGQEDSAKKILNIKLIFQAEQTKKENIIIKTQKAEIQKKNIELQDTIEELTLTKVGKKAKAFTLLIAIVFFIFEDSILHFVFHLLSLENFWASLVIKGTIIFSLKPINTAIEHYLLKKVVRRKKRILEEEEEIVISPELNFNI